MNRVFVSLGSNIRPEENIGQAIQLLDRTMRVRAVSTVYQTEPLNADDGPQYYNCVVEVETDADPLFLKTEVLRTIETALGRVRGGDKNAARTIDLDLIVYGDVVRNSGGLTIPDPAILSRPFLAIPLKELAPGMHLPGSGMTTDQAAENFSLKGMKPLDRYTEHIRKDILHDRTE